MLSTCTTELNIDRVQKFVANDSWPGVNLNKDEIRAAQRIADKVVRTDTHRIDSTLTLSSKVRSAAVF